MLAIVAGISRIPLNKTASRRKTEGLTYPNLHVALNITNCKLHM